MLRRVSAPLLLVSVVAAFFWKLLSRQYTWMDQPDIPEQVLPWLQAQAAAWHRGEFPLWDPHVWVGQPLLAQILPGAAYPLNWILFLFPMPGGHIQLYLVQLSFVVTHCLAALFAYWLCRDLNCSRSAAVFGGLAFSLSGAVAWLGFPQMLNGAIWIPLIIGFTLRALRDERPVANAALSGTFLGIAFLSGHHQIPTFTALALAGLWIADLVRRRGAALLPIAVLLVSAAATSAAQILPAIEYGLRSVRWVGAGVTDALAWNQPVPYFAHEALSMTPLQILGMILPSIGGDGVFVGLTIVVLALAGFVAGGVHTRQLGALVAGGLLFALGASTVFQGVAYWALPLVEKARTPALAIVIAQFALAILAAKGFDSIREKTPGRVWILSLVLAGAVVWGALAVFAPLRPESSREYHQWAVLGIVCISLAALFRWKGPAVLLFLVMLFELSTVVTQNYHHRDQPAGYLAELDANHDVIDFVRRQPDFIRLEVNRTDIPMNLGDWYGFDVLDAMGAGVTANINQFGPRPEIFALTHYLGREQRRPGQQLLFRGASGVGVFRNPEASPAAWVVHRARQVPQREIVGWVVGADVRKEAILTVAPPVLETCEAPESAQIVQKSSNNMSVNAHLSCRGMLILSETFYPGWQATVDGRSTEILEADGALRGVILERGDHRVEFRYRPLSVYLGAALTLLGLIAAVLISSRRISQESA